MVMIAEGPIRSSMYESVGTPPGGSNEPRPPSRRPMDRPGRWTPLSMLSRTALYSRIPK